MASTQWLDEAVQRTKEKYKIQRAQEERLAHEEELKRRLGGQYCRQLFAWLQSIEGSFNNKFGSHVLAVSVSGDEGSRSAQILARPILTEERIAHLDYQNNSASLRFSIGSGKTADTPHVIKLILSADEALLAEIGSERYTSEQLGQKIIDDLLA
jgi:hypothetical protein